MERKMAGRKNKPAMGRSLLQDIAKQKQVYLMAIPVILFYIIFCYAPMYGIQIAFKDFVPRKGISGSEWVGLTHFVDFLTNPYFIRVFKNTLVISLYDILFAFPAPILFAVLLNEVRNTGYRKTIQTVTYLPYFISLMVVCGMLKMFLAKDGFINEIGAFFGAEKSNLLANPSAFRTIFVGSNIWQNIGWESIIYLSALTALDQELFEAAKIDGAGKFKQIVHITIPGIMPTIVILLIMRIGSLMTVNFEKVILLYNPLTMDTADVISSYVYRKGIEEMSYSFSTAVGLFNSIINFLLLFLANFISRRVNETSLW